MADRVFADFDLAPERGSAAALTPTHDFSTTTKEDPMSSENPTATETPKGNKPVHEIPDGLLKISHLEA